MRVRVIARKEPPRTRRSRASIAADAIAALLGFGVSFSVHLIGNLQVSEVLLLFLLPFFLLTRGKRILRRDLRPVFLLMLFWLIGQILSDIYRHTAFQDWTRGDALIIFFGINLVGFVILLARNVRRQVIFVAAFSIGSLVQARFIPPLGEPDWKFGYSTGTITLVVLASCYFYGRRHFVAAGLLLAAIAVVNLLLNFRSPVLFLLITIALLVPVIPEHVGRVRLLPAVGGVSRIFVLAALALIAGAGANALVHAVTRAGLLGAYAEEKNQSEFSSGRNLLLSGRPEIFVSSRAVLDSPILGHGSWAKDYKYFEMDYDIENQYLSGEDLDTLEAESEALIPSHSYLMGAWVWAGIAGAAFWFYILWVTFKSIVWNALLQPHHAPLYMWVLIGSFWNILFSPFGNAARPFEALAILFALNLLESAPRTLRPSRRPGLTTWKRQPYRTLGSSRSRISPTSRSKLVLNED